jgi:hypothetical protein
MIARTRNVSFLAFIRRLDRWLLLRAPMLWRTRPVYLLVLLSLAVIAAIPFIGPFIETRIKDASELVTVATNTVSCWWWWFWGSAVVIALWVRSIIRKPVGELAPHRHIVTVGVVAVGSYLWLITPSLLAYPQIDAIKRFGPNSRETLRDDYRFLSEYSDWNCVTPDVWDNLRVLKRLSDILSNYGYVIEVKDLTKGEIPKYPRDCQRNGVAPLNANTLVSNSRAAIETIAEARGDPLFSFSGTGIDFWLSWWLAAAGALGIGILTAILSYPSYVWRRTFVGD